MRCRHSIEIERQRIKRQKRLSDYSFLLKIYHYKRNTTSPNCGYTYRSYYGFTLAHFLFVLKKSPRENPCLHSFRVNSQLLWWDFHPLGDHSLRGTLTFWLSCVLMQFRFCVCPAWASGIKDTKLFQRVEIPCRQVGEAY